MLKEETNRGFSIINFTDVYGQECSLQKSSSAKEDRIWLGVGKNISGTDVNCRMHLNIEQVRLLLPYLEQFIKSGDL